MATETARRLCFFHIQKCGGTSLKDAIRGSFLPRSPDQIVFDLDAEAATLTAGDVDLAPFAFRDRLLLYGLRSRHTRVAMGHFRYTDRLHGPFLESNHFVTVLRQPESRLLSAYFYDRFKAGEYGKIHEPLRDFLLDANGVPTSRGRIHAEKYIPMFRGDGVDDHRLASPADIDAAIRNLTRFSAVGFLEDLDPFLAQLSEWADAPLMMPELNKSPANDAQRAELTDELRDVVTEICAPAQIVYDRVRDHFLG
jgi:hypothetical protein